MHNESSNRHAQPFNCTGDVSLSLTLPLIPLIVYANSRGSGETAQTRPSFRCSPVFQCYIFGLKFELPHDKTNKTIFAHSEDSDQLGHSPSLNQCLRSALIG